MKSKLALALPICAALVVCVLAAGTVSDPLATLSYLTDTFTRQVDREVELRLDRLDQAQSSAPEDPGDSSALWTESRVKTGDILAGNLGAMVMVLAGDVRVDYGGAVVDVSAGSTVDSGSTLAVNHRYLVAEDTSAAFTVISKTAVVDYQGPLVLWESDNVDYNRIAYALRNLRLFLGGPTGYGQGLALESAPTRLQALIMFIRVLGEEEEALAWNGTTPFRDVESGSQGEKYIGYAFDQGYTTGYGDTFRSGDLVNANQYTEFMLRAMGYSSTANTKLSDALERGRDAGLFQEGEMEMFREGPFLRADLVYISYCALHTPLPDGKLLAERLMDKGIFTDQEWEQAREMAPSFRP